MVLEKRSSEQNPANRVGIDPRTDKINTAIQSELTVTLTLPANRFYTQIAGNRMVVIDSTTNLFEVISEAFPGHGPVRRTRGEVFAGGYSAVIQDAKRRLVIRAVNGEHADVINVECDEIKLIK